MKDKSEESEHIVRDESQNIGRRQLARVRLPRTLVQRRSSGRNDLVPLSTWNLYTAVLLQAHLAFSNVPVAPELSLQILDD